MKRHVPAALRVPFGTLPDGTVVEAVTLLNSGGMQVTLITYGAGIQSVIVPDQRGELVDVALGHATLAPYVEQPQYLGSTVGRVANRIAGGCFELEGHTYRVPLNDGPNALHGGAKGFDKVNWDVVAVTNSAVRFGYISPDGAEGFPGILRVTACYTLNDDNELSVEYQAVGDAVTLVNITNHAYWNLAGEGAESGALDHRLTIFADDFLPVDATLIPTGDVRSVAGTPFDFRRATTIGDRVRDASDEQIRIGHGYDHNWVIARDVSAEPRRIARLEHLSSGRVLDVISDQPGVQFYSGNFLDGTTIGKAGRAYRAGDAVVLEPQMFPDTPNRPAFGSLRLSPGETYRHKIVFRFTTAALRQ